ncbi:AzlC family ABC transporter permease [Pelagibaculum spongiae]|uniref:AzlC family ABC transporter permease n=1 Tax=Pelagibaculum spongiae TaxID=2080658 RepID=UPI00131473B8|nr:AzlC family ABC transporter permease [Pelagibaculum spongiae]
MDKIFFWSGVRRVSPTLLSITPFGLIAGIAALESGMTPLQAQLSSVAFFAGSAQIASAQLLASGAPLLIAIATAMLINLRFMMYSAVLAPELPITGSPIKRTAKKMGLAYFLTDQVFALTHLKIAEQPSCTLDERVSFYLGCALPVWLCWQLATAAGIIFGNALPASWPIEFSIPLTFLALLFPTIKDKPGAIAAVVAGLLALLFHSLPWKLGLVAGAIGGIIAGGFSEGMINKKTAKPIQGAKD